MRINYTNPISEASGAMSNIVFFTNKGSAGGKITIARQNFVPYNPNSVNQQKTRNHFKAACDIWKNATTVTIGTTTWDRDVFLADYLQAARDLGYRGVATSGPNAGRQLFIAALVKNGVGAEPAGYSPFNDLLPQDASTEGDLQNWIGEMIPIYSELASMHQKDRIGYKAPTA